MSDQLALSRMQAIQDEMLTKPQIAIDVTHIFVNGMCSRTIAIPADVRLMGAVHLTDHLNVMQGDITISYGGVEKRFTGYHVIPSPAGVKRMGVTHAPTTWTTILRTDLKTAEEVEEQLIAINCDDPRVIAITKLTEIGE